MTDEIYLDWNATTPPAPEVLEAMAEAAGRDWGNPSSVHASGRRARQRVEDARERLASLIDVHPRDVVFTSGGTEANNLALAGVRALVTSRLEHPSVTKVAERLEAQGGVVRWLEVPDNGRLQAVALERALAGLESDPAPVVAVMAANHETGVLQPIEELGRVAQAHGARLHVDAVQALGKIEPAQFRAANSMAFAAHKLRGPKGIGALAWRGRSAPPALFAGGGQERGIRPGTVDPVLVVGFGKALERACNGPERYRDLASLRDRIEGALARYAAVNGDTDARLPHVSNLSVAGWRGDELVAALDLEGVRVSAGSACSAGTVEPSPVIAAMLGLERALAAIRVSLGEETHAEQIERVISVMLRLVAGKELA